MAHPHTTAVTVGRTDHHGWHWAWRILVALGAVFIAGGSIAWTASSLRSKEAQRISVNETKLWEHERRLASIEAVLSRGFTTLEKNQQIMIDLLTKQAIPPPIKK